MIHYRPAKEEDLNHLIDLDVKCQSHSASLPGWWDEIADRVNTNCCVACISHVPIGMVVWERQMFKLPEFSQKQYTAHVHKICVRPDLRNAGIGKRLLAEVHEFANSNGCPYITIAVPEYQCVPSETEDEIEYISPWLIKLGFIATILLPVKIQLYGEDHDQYLFVFGVKK